MSQRIVEEYPPAFDQIAKAFPAARNKGVIFSWGDIIYNPSGLVIPSHLIAHEAVHGRRQEGMIEEWWHAYILDPLFRLGEEVWAHKAELQFIIDQGANRQRRRQSAREIAKRLAGPLYGNLISKDKAMQLITG